MARVKKKVHPFKLLTLLLLLTFILIPLTYAGITVPPTTHFGYGNETYFTQPGTYDNITRINNVWFFDVYAYIPSDEAKVYFLINTALGFQAGNQIVRLTPIVNVLNGSHSNYQLSSDGGKFWFTAQEDSTIELQYENVDVVKVNGESYGSGSTFTVVSSIVYNIEWGFVMAPYLPILFIIGVIGACGMIGGPSYAIHKIKKHEYEEGLVNGVIIFAIGLGFFIGWLTFGGI